MTRKIFRAIVACALIVLAICVATMSVCLYQSRKQSVFREMDVEAELIARGCEASGAAYFETIPSESNRITWIAADGAVLYDSFVDAASLSNHAQREEVRMAKQNGSGKCVRMSDTLLERTYYYALALKDGSVVRVASTQPSNGMTALSLMPWTAALVLVSGGIAVVFARRLTKKIVAPINEIDPENPCAQDCYEELRPLLQRIERQNELSRVRMADMKREKDAPDKQEAMRREFTANVSHELKTPLTSIYGISEMMMNGIVKPEDMNGFAKTIHDESGRLINLVADILHLSQLDEEGHLEMGEAVDLYEVSERVLRRLAEPAKQRNINLHLYGQKTVIRGNYDLAEELLYNLVDNAIKYNKEDGEVDVTVEPFDSGARWIVRDTGIGIAKEHLPRVFERFYRVDKGHSRKIGGTGLGLSIVKHAAAELSAAVKIQSEPNVGTTVTVTF